MSVVSVRFWLLSQSPWLSKLSLDAIGNIIQLASPHWTEDTTRCDQVLDKKCGGHTRGVSCVSWSPLTPSTLTHDKGGKCGGTYVSGKQAHSAYLASGSSDKTVRIWKLNPELNHFECIQVLDAKCGGHTKTVTSVSWSPFIDGKSDSKYFHCGSGTRAHSAYFHCGSGKRARSAYVHRTRAHSAYLASGSNDHTIRIWKWNDSSKELDETNKLRKLECIQVLDRKCGGHTHGIACISWSPDGKYFRGKRAQSAYVHRTRAQSAYLASGSWDKTIRIWKLDTELNRFKCIQVLDRYCGGHTHWVTCVSWSPNGKYLASGSVDSTIRIWTLNTELNKFECIQVLNESCGEHTSIVSCVSWSPLIDGKSAYLASGSSDATIRIWKVARASDKTNKFTCIQVLDASCGGHTRSVRCVSWSLDGKYFHNVSRTRAQSAYLASGLTGGTIRIWKWDPKLNKFTYIQVMDAECGGHTRNVKSISWSPSVDDTQHLASGSLDETIRIWKSD